MLAKFVTAGVAGSLLLASAAFAAETSTTNAPNAAATAGSVSDISYQGTWRASKVAGLSVYNDQNENIGTINDLLMDKSGNIKGAVISVGGFLGMGSRYVAVAYDKLKFSDQPVPYTGASNTNGPGGARPPMVNSTTSTTTTGSATNSPATPPVNSKPNPWYPDHAMLNASKDELTKMPEFKYSE
jgi:sporulation protein YlmC with PRC-barrel domain